MYRETFLLMESYSFLRLLNIWRFTCHQWKMIIQGGNTLRCHQRGVCPRLVQKNLDCHLKSLQRSLAPVLSSRHPRSIKSSLQRSLLRKELLLQRRGLGNLLQRRVLGNLFQRRVLGHPIQRWNLQRSSFTLQIPYHPVTRELKSTLRYIFNCTGNHSIGVRLVHTSINIILITQNYC